MTRAPRPHATGLAALCLAALAGCAGPPSAGSELPLYRCEYAIEFRVRFVDNTAVLDGNRGYDVLHRDGAQAGRTYSNPRMSAEFGLGPSGREALLRYPLLPLAARCVRE